MRRRPNHYNRRLIRIITILIVGLLVLGGGFWAGTRFIPLLSKLPFVPNNQVIDFHTYFALDPETPGLILEDTRLTSITPPVVEGGVVYLPASFVRDYMDEFIFWDAYAEALYVTTTQEVMRFRPGAPEYSVNDEKKVLSTPIRLLGEDTQFTAYLPSDLVEMLYPFHIDYQPAYNMVIITSLTDSPSRGVAKADKKTELRYRADTDTPIEVKIAKGDVLTLYEEDGEFTRVRTADGLLGYVRTARLTPAEPADGQSPSGTSASRASYVSPWPAGVKINMMWEAVYPNTNSEALMETPLPEGVNVISPTWFSFDEESLEMVTFGSRAYVDWAHEQGCQVWGMLADDSGSISHAVLTDAAVRRRAITQLISYADAYGLDGLNIDFEHVREDDGAYFIQFLRELAPTAREKNLILSVDVYVPAAWSEYYRRDLIGKTVDFVCVMTYDEHYPGSPASGPVASLPFVSQGVLDMLAQVPKEQLLMGLPYYNRIWREIVNNDSPETRKVQHFGMDRARTFLEEQGIVPEWDAETGSYYGEFAAVEESETVLYRVWLEDARSITEKLKIFESQDLAGVAGWRRGFENEAVWELLREYVR